MTERLLPLVELWELALRAFEESFTPLGRGPDDWARLSALADRLHRDGFSTATPAEEALLRGLQEDATFALARSLVSGPGRDLAIARARLADAHRRARKARRAA